MKPSRKEKMLADLASTRKDWLSPAEFKTRTHWLKHEMVRVRDRSGARLLSHAIKLSLGTLSELWYYVPSYAGTEKEGYTLLKGFAVLRERD
jgi:hypothetical protein